MGEWWTSRLFTAHGQMRAYDFGGDAPERGIAAIGHDASSASVPSYDRHLGIDDGRAADPTRLELLVRHKNELAVARRADHLQGESTLSGTPRRVFIAEQPHPLTRCRILRGQRQH